MPSFVLLGAYSALADCEESEFETTFNLPISAEAGNLVVCSASTIELTNPPAVAGSYDILDSPLSNLTVGTTLGVAWALVFGGAFEVLSISSPAEAVLSDSINLDCDGLGPGFATATFTPGAPYPNNTLRVQMWRYGSEELPDFAPSAQPVSGVDYETGFLTNACFGRNGIPPCAPIWVHGMVGMSYVIDSSSAVSSTFDNCYHIPIPSDAEYRFTVGKEVYGWGVLLGSG